jgi:1-acyl-sn-glycerol-3-phosphate acyltransferase
MRMIVWWIRSALYMAWLIVTVVPYAVAAVLLSLVLRGRPLYRFCVGWAWLALWGSRVLCGIRWRVQGLENLPSGPAVVLVKHQSAWETLALPLLLPRALSYVFKRELLMVPFFGWALGRLDMVHIDRKRGAQALARMQERGAQLLQEGYWIVMFPEGTRTPRGGQGQYKQGGARLSQVTGAPVVPIAVTSARCWPRQAFIKRPGLIDVSIGAPIDPRGMETAQINARMQGWIEAEMRRLDPEAYAPAAQA